MSTGRKKPYNKDMAKPNPNSTSYKLRSLLTEKPTLTPAEAATLLGVSFGGSFSVLFRRAKQSLGLHQLSHKALIAEADAKIHSTQLKNKDKVLEKLADAAAATERLCKIANSVLIEPLPALPTFYTPPKGSGNTPEDLVVLLSDTHVGQVIDISQTQGFGEYNISFYLHRLKFWENFVTKTIRQSHAPVKNLHLILLGDMIHGALSHSSEADQHFTIFQQVRIAGDSIAQAIRNIACHVPNISVSTAVGNHARWQNQHKVPSVNTYSNLDMMLYSYLEALTKDLKNVKWDIHKQAFSVIDVLGTTIHASHGDHWKGGDKALGIPNHAIGRQLSTTAQLFGKYNRKVPNVYVVGHWHRPITIPHATGKVLINGAFPGLDGYALRGNFNPVDPCQILFFVHPKYGVTATYEAKLAFAEVTNKLPYVIDPKWL